MEESGPYGKRFVCKEKEGMDWKACIDNFHLESYLKDVYEPGQTIENNDEEYVPAVDSISNMSYGIYNDHIYYRKNSMMKKIPDTGMVAKRIAAMIDFGPLLEKPWLMLFGAAAQFGIFFTLFLAGFFFDMKDAASIAVIGAADGPTAIFVANTLKSQYLGAIMVAAYSYMALVPIVQPPVIRLLTTQKERRIRMPYEKGNVTQLTKILFPVVVTVVAGLVAPASVALVGFLMFGNLLRECGVLNSLSETAQNVLANLITLLLGLTVAGQMTADKFVRPDTLLIMALGLVAFIFDTAGGVLFAKLVNLFLPEGKKLNPMIGAAGISAFPMSGRVVNKMGLAEDNQNFLLMYSISVNVSGQIASVLAGGLILSLMA